MFVDVSFENAQNKDTIWETRGELVYEPGRRETTDIRRPSLNAELQIPWFNKPTEEQEQQLIPGIICSVDNKEFNIESVNKVNVHGASISYIFRLNGGKPCVPRTSGSR